MGWLPLYHDMGLIGDVLQPLFLGTHCILMSPMAFLQRPARWLEAISHYRATTSGAPNFAYDLCVRKIPAEQRALLDLSSWEVAFNGAEPVRAETMDKFAEAFGPCGFRREAFHPCYGLAEATLLVAARRGGGPVVTTTVSAQRLKEGEAREAAEDESGAVTLVSCGIPPEQHVVIVNPDTSRECRAGEVGEIWVAGPSVARGYWNNHAETERTFGVRLAPTGAGPFLRTGDLGFLHGGELFVTGRLKDLIIIRGLNHYPQDIERTVEQSHPALRPGCGAAFSVEAGGREELVVVQELEARHRTEPSQVIEDIRRELSLAHEVQVSAVVLIRHGSIAKTSSGKIQRHACRAAFMDERLDVVAEWRAPLGGEGEATATAFARRDEGGAESVEEWLVAHLAALLRVVPSEIDPAQPVGSYGLDSLSAIELMHGVETHFGVSLPMTTFLKSPSVDDLAALVRAAGSGDETATPREPAETGALSHGQRALWFLQQLAPESPAYNLAFAARVRSGLEVESLRRALQTLVGRHASLRTTIGNERGEPFRQVHEDVTAHLRLLDAVGWDAEELTARLTAEAQTPST